MLTNGTIKAHRFPKYKPASNEAVVTNSILGPMCHTVLNKMERIIRKSAIAGFFMSYIVGGMYFHSTTSPSYNTALFAAS